MYKAGLLLLAMLLAGCSSMHEAPLVAYSTQVALADTAIFSSFDELSAATNDSHVLLVDEKKLSAYDDGNPYWVRVLPGDHKFRVRYAVNQRLGDGSASAWAFLDIDVDDMKPRHVYVTRYAESDGRVRMHVEDLGELTSYSISPHKETFKTGF